MRLTEQQLRYFETFGFLKFPGLFAEEADAITEAFEHVWAMRGGGHGGKRHDGKYRSALLQFIDHSEYLSALIDDPRIDDVYSSLLGDDYNYTGSDGNYYVGDSQWHSDLYHERKYVSVKVALYLDPVARETGCLRVIPGSHQIGDKYGDALDSQVHIGRSAGPQESFGLSGGEIPAVALESEPGDMLMFNHCIKHSSFGGGDRRRMFTINAQQRYLDEELEELRDDIGGRANFWVESAYGETMVRTSGPARMRHLEQLLANDGHLPELARKARERMSEPSRGGPQYERPA